MTVIEHRWLIFPAGAWPANLRNALGLIWQRQVPSQDSQRRGRPRVFPRRRCSPAPRSQGEPIQSNGAGGDGDDNGGVDDGDQAFTATALTLAERVPSANFNMQKMGPAWRGDRKEFRDCGFMGAVPGHSTAPLGKLTVDAADFMFLTGCSNQFIPVEYAFSRSVYSTNVSQRVWLAIEDDCWNILALENVNSLAASIALKKNLVVRVRSSPISQVKEIAMKYTTIALAIAFTVPSTLALARGHGGGMHIGSSVSRPFSSPVGSGRIANRPRNATGNTLTPIARDPSGSTFTGTAMNRTAG